LRWLQFSLALVVLGTGEAQARPWPARRPPVNPPASHQLRNISRWPTEPPAPPTIDVDRFRKAVAYLCRRPVEQTPADEVLASSREAGVDAFLLAALMVEQSRCDAKRSVKGTFGLLAIAPALYRSEGAPKLAVHPTEWAKSSLLAPRSNLGLGARLLRMWQDQHEEIDEAFGGVPHRSAVSHFVWGDVVGSSGAEDLVLTARRRLLVQYDGRKDVPAQSGLGVAVVPPLEAIPRVATSGPGDDRDGGARRHQGLDIAATIGEPVHAIADGKVIFAGVNLPRNGRFGPVPPSKIRRYARKRMGAGGIYLCIRHTPEVEDDKGVVSCYMHLESYVVSVDDPITAGQIVGYVGRTGVKVSPPHLHLEVRLDGRRMDPLRYLSDVLIPPAATLTHVYNIKLKRARIRAARAAASAPTPGS
jgi:murein DD-endopeptidase MepM/ murein hydrolase activator NlpD